MQENWFEDVACGVAAILMCCYTLTDRKLWIQLCIFVSYLKIPLKMEVFIVYAFMYIIHFHVFNNAFFIVFIYVSWYGI